jgi:hypothetical protein
MSQRHPNVIYLNPEGQPHPGKPLTIQSPRLHEELGDEDGDLRPLLADYPIDADGLYFGTVAPSDDVPFMWPHQIHQIMKSQCHVIKDSDRSEPLAYPDDSVIDASYPGICAILTTARHHGKASPELLQKQWGIGYETAQKTIEVTTQLVVRHATHPLRQRYQTNLLSLKHKRINEEFHSDTLFSKYESYSKNTCAQVFTTQSGFVVVYPMTSKSRCAKALTTLVQDVGIPNCLFCDNAPEMVGPKTDFRKTTNYYKIKLLTNEPHTPKQNRIAEGTIGHMRQRWLTIQQQKQVSLHLWDFGLVWIAEIMSRTYQAHNRRMGLEVVTSDTCNISEYVDFSFYNWVWFWHTPSSQEPAQPGRWLGVSHRVGTVLCYWVLTRKGSILSRSTVQNVTELEMQVDENKKLFDDMDVEIKRKMDGGAHATEPLPNLLYLEDEPADGPECFNVNGFVPDVDNVDGYDEYIGAELMFDFMGDDAAWGRVIKRAKGENGQPLGARNANPILDTRMYTVQLSDGSHCELSANIIAENLYAQVNEQGHQQLIFREIFGHRTNGDYTNDMF